MRQVCNVEDFFLKRTMTVVVSHTRRSLPQQETLVPLLVQPTVAPLSPRLAFTAQMRERVA